MKKLIKYNILNILILLYLELMFSLVVFSNFNIKTEINKLLYIIILSFFITAITTIFKEKIGKKIFYIIYLLISIWFAAEHTFNSFLHTFLSFSLIKLSDQAVGFIGETVKIIFNNIPGILLFFLPFILLIILRKKIKLPVVENKQYLLAYIPIIIIASISYNQYLKTDKNYISSYNLYHEINNTPLRIQKLGVLAACQLDGTDYILKKEKTVKENIIDISKENKNILDLDLSDKNLDPNIKKYIQSNSGTTKNEYSGYFKNKNLVFVVAESYSEIAVDKDLTPTLYKLTNSGLVFDNFYIPYYLSTIGGEFQSLTGLYPSEQTLSIWKKGQNSYPYGLGKVFKEKGYNIYAYHGHDGYFQNRNKYLNSIGLDNFKACNLNLNINCNIFPESDLEMIEETHKDYINSDKPFLAYYMTISGHLEYNFKDNDIAIKNKKYVDNLSHSESEKAYIAGQIELDKALELLINKLEESGKLDDTVIILLADHYPYNLSLEEINNLSSYERDKLFEINHNSLVIWNNNIETKHLSKVGMPIDIVPTIYNLFDIRYDSRIFTGEDLLSEEEGLVILNNLSWITNKGKYNSEDSKTSVTLDKEYIEKINNKVQNKIIFSKKMIEKDGYKYIKEK